MIRTKAKGLLLCVTLVLACFCFFACKETKVKVDTISFTEQTISMLVGDEYTPEVKILPSYATNRGYTLVSDDVTALKIEGGTITALKPAMGVVLKVISNENSAVNSAITVNIYAEADELETPTDLTYNSSNRMFSFVAEDNGNASSYVLKFGEKEINIGNNTEYSFDSIVAKLGYGYNQALSCKVRAVGDGRVFKDSPYTQEISFVQLSAVTNVRIESEVLYFDGIENIASYNINIIKNGQIELLKIAQNPSKDKKVISVDISDLNDELGAEYSLSIIADNNNYGTDDITVYSGTPAQINYNIIGRVQNVSINNKIISWDFVKNAQNYTVKIYKNNNLLTTYEKVINNYINLNFDEASKYYCQIIANSAATNTTTSKQFSQKLYFEILSTPTINAENNTITWNAVDNAEGYIVKIKKGETALVNKYILTTEYDVRDFVAGDYNIEVTACGNGRELLDSKVSQKTEWTILNKLQVNIENKKLYWIDNDIHSMKKYHLIFSTGDSGSIDKVFTSADYGDKYFYDDSTGRYIYDLSGYNLAPEIYTISVQSIGEGSVFDADINVLSLIKLKNTSIKNIENLNIEINPATNATSYQVKIYSVEDSEFENALMTLENMKSGYKFALDASVLEAGDYLAKVFVLGNNGKVLDADNGNIGTTYPFTKLKVPTLEISSTDNSILIENLIGAQQYKLFENSSTKTLSNSETEYSLNGLSAGDYAYKVQAIGNNANILDSDITASEDCVNVKKLDLPNIAFDKESLTFTMSSDEEQYIKDYTLSIAGVTTNVESQADCSQQIVDANTYVAEVCANPVTNHNDFDLIIKSNITQYSVKKLATGFEFEIIFDTHGAKLIINPTYTLNNGEYQLQVKISNADNSVVINDFNYNNQQFTTNLYDAKYNLTNQDIATLWANPGEYDVHVTLMQSLNDVVSSDEEKLTNKLMVLDTVKSISKKSQNIEFDIVENAENYVAIIELNGDKHCVDITGKYVESSGKNVLKMADLLELMAECGIEYVEEEEYLLSFVSTTTNTSAIANKSELEYNFQFLAAPTINIAEKEGNNVKYIEILNNNEKTINYNIELLQDDMTIYKASWIKSQEEKTYISLDDISQIEAKQFIIKVSSSPIENGYFESKYSQISATKINTTEISVENSLIVWDCVENAKQYNLIYVQNGERNIKKLRAGSENFVISGGKCKYNFDLLDSGLASLYMQVDSELNVGGHLYINSATTEAKQVYKLPTLDVQVKQGAIYTEIVKSDLALIERIEVSVNKSPVDIDIMAEDQEYIKLNEIGSNRLSVTIDPVALLKYGNTAGMLLENIEIKLYAKAEAPIPTLNSSIANKSVYGLINPLGLDISTSAKRDNEEAPINEIWETIRWTNPMANGAYVSKYQVIINYNGKDCEFITNETALLMPKYYDENQDGVHQKGEDANNNGELDDGEDLNENGVLDTGEIEFGAGTYTIKVRALTNNNENIVNSKYCDEITVTILATPTDLSTKGGNVIWSSDINVEYSLIKVYLLNNNDKTLILTTETKGGEFDFSAITLDEGIYGISVQAMNDNSRILSSNESELLEVVRLPQVTSYYIDDGALYINAHAFFTSAEIYLTDLKAENPITYSYTLENADLKLYDNYVKGISSWSTSNILSTYTNDSYYVSASYRADGDQAFLTALAEGYTVQIKLCGNTKTKGAIISGNTSTILINTSHETSANSIVKLVTPTITVSANERGVFLLSVPDGARYETLKYFKQGTNALQGVHIYEINILASTKHTMYVAEIINQELFDQSLLNVGSAIIIDDETKNYLKHFDYGGYTFNIVDKNFAGHIPFNFSATSYSYYATNGEYTTIALGDGGDFEANARFMGDDTQFVMSNASSNARIRRYKILNLEASNGVIRWKNQAVNGDHPIYIITLTNETETYNLVLYNPNVYSDESVFLDCLDSGKEYIFDTIEYGKGEEPDDETATYGEGAENNDEYITYARLAQIIDEARAKKGETLGLGGVFLASIKSHYTNKASTDIILAQSAESKTVTILPQSQIRVENGLLVWNIANIIDTGGRQDIKHYLLEIFDETGNKLYQIQLDEGDYKIENNVASYTLPKTLSSGTDEGFMFEPGSNYIFKLVVLAGDESTTYINSIESETAIINLLPDIQDVKMENGMLVWTNTTANIVEVYVSYQYGDALIEYITTVGTNSFELPASFVDVGGTAREFISNIDYTIKVRLCGTTISLNGFYTEGVVTQRLETVPSVSDPITMIQGIQTDNGVVTWKANDIAETTYKIIYTLSDSSTGVIEGIESNQYDFDGIKYIVDGKEVDYYGPISLQIIAVNSGYFTSFTSGRVQLYKLNIPTNVVFNPGTTTITWDKVIDGEGNEINDYIISVIEGEGGEPVEYSSEGKNYWIIQGVTTTNFKVAIKAVGKGVASNVINSNYTAYQTMVQPYAVDGETFEFDDDLQAFIWLPIQEEDPGDKYYISYTYYAPDNGKQTIVSPIEVTTRKLIDDKEYYVYYPSVIGKYTYVSVQVVRAESLSSQPTYWEDEARQNELDFNLFAFGNGEDVPYKITTLEHLKNIKYFLNANYELYDNITLDGYTNITSDTQVFTGKINGRGKYIYGYQDDSMRIFADGYRIVGYEGLFAKTSGAIFENINLSEFKLNGYLGTSTLYMSMLVSYAENTSFNNINVNSSSITLIKNNEKGYTSNTAKIYIGAIAGYAVESEFTNCLINFGVVEPNINVSILGNGSTEIYIGAVAGFASDSIFANNTTITDDGNSSNDSAFIIQYSLIAVNNHPPTLSLGAVVGEVLGENTQLNGNSCGYIEYNPQGSTAKFNEIGNEN